MKKKSKNKSFYLVLMLLLLVGAGFTTYAIYKTSASGTANVSAANWIVKVTANSTTTNVTGGSNNINLGACATHLAPGGSCEIPFTIDMTESEVDSILTVNVGSGIEASTLSLMESAGISLKISDGTNIQNAYVLNYGTTKVLNLVIDWEAGLEDDDNKASADVALSKTVGTLTIPVNMVVRQFNGINRTVTFNKNSEDSNITTPEAITVSDGGYVTNIPDLNSENVIFVGWYTSPTGGTKLTSTTPITDNVTYYAHYGTMKTVTFNSTGGSETSSMSVRAGGTLSSLPNTTKTGKTLDGWYTAETGGTKITTDSQIDDDIILYAHWRDYNLGELVYFDPTSSSTTCSSLDPNNNDSSCMKWRVISTDTSGNDLNLQLDHNLIDYKYWVNESDYGSNQAYVYKGPITALSFLANSTSAWENVSLLNYEYDTSTNTYTNYGKLTCITGTCTASRYGNTVATNVRARMITAEEIVEITKTKANAGTLANWSLENQSEFCFSNTNYEIGTETSGIGNTDLSWLIENTRLNSSSGATNNTYSNYSVYDYYTLTPSNLGDTYGMQIYHVTANGMLRSENISIEQSIRPVITIPKSKIQ